MLTKVSIVHVMPFAAVHGCQMAATGKISRVFGNKCAAGQMDSGDQHQD
jgi:hypothetical protein